MFHPHDSIYESVCKTYAGADAPLMQDASLGNTRYNYLLKQAFKDVNVLYLHYVDSYSGEVEFVG
jgi:hypothetical protein